MNLRWHETGRKMFASGAIKHTVWRAYLGPGFYARSGLDVHGPYECAQAARKACQEVELKEGSSE